MLVLIVIAGMNGLCLNVFELISEMGSEWRGVQVGIWTCSDTKIDVSLKGKKEPKLTHTKNRRKQANTYGQRGTAVLNGTGAPC